MKEISKLPRVHRVRLPLKAVAKALGVSVDTLINHKVRANDILGVCKYYKKMKK